jgi:hypothetical protein
VSPQTDVMACAEKRRRDPIQNQEAAHLSWAKTVDREARTAPGRRAFENPAQPVDLRVVLVDV